MGIDPPGSADEEERVSTWEAQVATNNDLSIEVQAELRRILVSGDPALRERVIRLLNPWGVGAIDLPDDKLREWYSVVQENNYWRLPRPGSDSIMFDASHGYYVEPVVKPLR